ncbi:hypothetical protein H5410_008443 [Solanum commersonii]|uniref:Uncharacterized protein n=1 Tax=Solanum commersonii TaxID=4109 RepID=A0A9J6AFN9_SOLCO|nr:hypothetical protein H5410_008443 [Solanum commersonii]
MLLPIHLQSCQDAILSFCTNLESKDHFDGLGFKRGTHKKDNSIWKVERHTALASFSPLITATTDLLASLLIFLLKEVNLSTLSSVVESPFLLLRDDCKSLTFSLHCEMSSLIVPQRSRSLTDLSNKSSSHFAFRL